MMKGYLPLPDTQWTHLEGVGSTVEGREWFCETYRPAILDYLKIKCGSDEAEDVCQEFFSQVILGRDIPGRADRSKGSLRALLLTALKNFLTNLRRSQRAQKRGGYSNQVPLDEHPSTVPFLEDKRAIPPDLAFDKAWASLLMERALASTERECVRRGKSELFAALRPALESGSYPLPHTEIAKSLGIKVREVTLGLSRLRRMVGHYLYQEVSQTVENSQHFSEEWASIRRALEGDFE